VIKKPAVDGIAMACSNVQVALFADVVLRPRIEGRAGPNLNASTQFGEALEPVQPLLHSLGRVSFEDRTANIECNGEAIVEVVVSSATKPLESFRAVLNSALGNRIRYRNVLHWMNRTGGVRYNDDDEVASASAAAARSPWRSVDERGVFQYT